MGYVTSYVTSYVTKIYEKRKYTKAYQNRQGKHICHLAERHCGFAWLERAAETFCHPRQGLYYNPRLEEKINFKK